MLHYNRWFFHSKMSDIQSISGYIPIIAHHCNKWEMGFDACLCVRLKLQAVMSVGPIGILGKVGG